MCSAVRRRSDSAVAKGEVSVVCLLVWVLVCTPGSLEAQTGKHSSQKPSQSLLAGYAQALLQFEDFNLEHAQPLLERYRYHHLVFNDDIQACQGPAPSGSNP